MSKVSGMHTYSYLLPISALETPHLPNPPEFCRAQLAINVVLYFLVTNAKRET